MENNKLSFYNKIYQPQYFISLRKRDGIIALVFISIYFIFFSIECSIVNIENFFYLSSLFSIPIIFIIFYIAKFNFKSLGFSDKYLLHFSLVFIALTISSFIINIPRFLNGSNTIFDYKLNFFMYLFFIAFFEEIMFRAYLWPRLVVLMGKNTGTIVTGLLYGFTHFISAYFFAGMQFNLQIFLDGLVAQYIFVIIYAYSGNILVPILVHAAPHFFIITRTVDDLKSIIPFGN